VVVRRITLHQSIDSSFLKKLLKFIELPIYGLPNGGAETVLGQSSYRLPKTGVKISFTVQRVFTVISHTDCGLQASTHFIGLHNFCRIQEMICEKISSYILIKHAL
jgi:hypothetical protein